MAKQILNIVEFPILYKILFEIESNLNFKIMHYASDAEFLDTTKKQVENNKSISILVQNDSKLLTKDPKIKQQNLFFFDNFPMTISKIIEGINIHLIRHKYNFQSNINIKNYILDINSRIISKGKKNTKLTEKEIEIILFLNNSTAPKNINSLQQEVWGFKIKLETHTVETHVYRLRKKIKDEFNDESFLKSEKDGYSI